jgi:hypothetical protein
VAEKGICGEWKLSNSIFPAQVKRAKIKMTGKNSSVIMLVAPGGKERTEAEYRALLEAVGFELTILIPVLTPYYIIEAVRV